MRAARHAHALAKGLLERDAFTSGVYELEPGFEAREVPFTYNGKQIVTYGLFVTTAV